MEEATKNQKERKEKIEKMLSDLPKDGSRNLKKEIKTIRSNRRKKLKAYRIRRVK